MSRIFTPFYRSPRNSRSASGVGIGLAVCRRLVEAMGSTIWARNRPEGGAGFGFALPLADPSADPAAGLDDDAAPLPVTAA